MRRGATASIRLAVLALALRGLLGAGTLAAVYPGELFDPTEAFPGGLDLGVLAGRAEKTMKRSGIL